MKSGISGERNDTGLDGENGHGSAKPVFECTKEGYLKARTKREKGRILDEYCADTGQARKYVIRKIQPGVDLRPKRRKKRKEVYDGPVTAALGKVWEIFDYPCGQRLQPMLELELPRLITFGEINVPDEVVLKLGRMSSATIDRKLKHQRSVLHLLREKSSPKPGSLKKKIPIRLTEWDTAEVGYTEMDTVAHCGSSTSGEFVNTLSNTEIASGWWEGEAIMSKAQESTFHAARRIRERSPFAWKGIDTDNGSEFINDALYKYCSREKLVFTRSRPSRKNDNAYIEEKNWTHVRKILGYLRYDTSEEITIINRLYRGDLRLYKNFFQPVMKLVHKERIGGRIKRKYDIPKTPYRRLMESGQLSEQAKQKLEALYLTLNPAQLKRNIDTQLEELYQTYSRKSTSPHPNPTKKQVPRTVTSFMIEQSPVGLPT